MTVYSFANLGDAVLKYQDRMDFTLKHAVEKLIEAAQTPKAKGGRMPVDTGALRNSLLSELNGGAGIAGDSSYVFVVANIEAGDFAMFRWTMEYAYFQNNGANGRPGNHFVEWAADQWQKFVNEGAKLAIARYP